MAAHAAPSFHGDVLPVLEQRCQPCHKAGEIAPMAFTTYREVRPWAKAIREAVLRKKMPPWFVEKASVEFENDPRLTDAEIRTIDEWVKAGAPEGKAPPAETQTLTVEPERADLIIKTPKAFHSPSRGEVEYHSIIVPLKNLSDLWVNSVELRPSVREVIHHMVAYVREPGSDWLRDKPVGEYFPHQGVTTSDILAVYTPGQGPARLPAGMAKLIPAESELVLQLHVTPSGKSTNVDVEIRITLAREAPARRVLTLQMNNVSFRIPSFAPDYRVQVTGSLPGDALLLSMLPHMHLRGKAFDYEVIGEGGRAETLLRVAPYDFYWQLNYRLKEPRLLKKGTRLRFTAWYDNSANNPRNPDPSAEVSYGEQSREEMMVGFFDVAVDPKLDKRAFFGQR